MLRHLRFVNLKRREVLVSSIRVDEMHVRTADGAVLDLNAQPSPAQLDLWKVEDGAD